MTRKPENFLRSAEVIRRTGRSRTAIHRDMKAGKFPKPIAIGPRAMAWLESEIDAWMTEQVRISRDAQMAASERQTRRVPAGVAASATA